MADASWHGKNVSDMTSDEIRAMAGASPDPVALLAAIRDRNEAEINRKALTDASVAQMPEGDVRLLLKVAEAALALAAKLEPQAPASSALEEDRMWIRQECAGMIREAVTAVLLGKENPRA